MDFKTAPKCIDACIIATIFGVLEYALLWYFYQLDRSIGFAHGLAFTSMNIYYFVFII